MSGYTRPHGHPNTRVISIEKVGDDCLCHSRDTCYMTTGDSEEVVTYDSPEHESPEWLSSLAWQKPPALRRLHILPWGQGRYGKDVCVLSTRFGGGNCNYWKIDRSVKRI